MPAASFCVVVQRISFHRGDFQMVLPLVLVGLHLADVSLFHQAVDLVGGVGRGDPHEGGKFVDRGSPQGQDGLHAESLHRGKARLPVLEAAEDLLVEVEFEFRIHVKKSLLQHSTCAHFPAIFLFFHSIAILREIRNRHFAPMAKVSSAEATTLPSTVALASPTPTGPRRLVRTHSSSTTSPGVTLDLKRAFLMPPK